MDTAIDFKRINNDVNGNPRYVCHFLEFLNESDKHLQRIGHIAKWYDIAIKRAKTIGGKRYNNKSYGGGIVFQSYNLLDTEKCILGLLK